MPVLPGGHGNGSISVSGGQASFTFSEQNGKPGHHFLSYSDPAHQFSFSTKKLSPVTVIGNHAHFTGTAKLGGKHGPTISFTVDVYDNGASNDQFFLSASNGYSAGGTLTSGNIFIH